MYPGFTYSACGPFTKNKKEYKNSKKQEICNTFIKTNQIKLTLKIYLEEQLLIKYYVIEHFLLPQNPKQDGYQRSLTSSFSTSGGAVNSEIMPNQRPSGLATKQLAKESHKPIIRTFEKRKVHSSFIDNIWGVDLADIQLISKFNKGFQFLQ